MSREFDWDEPKRRANIKEHGIDFVLAARIFNGPTLEEIDDREDYGEERIIAYGHVDGVVLRIVYTLRDDATRIITAQRASKRAEEEYYQEVYPR